MSGYASLGEVCDMAVGFAFKSKDFSTNPQGVFLIKGSNVSHMKIDYAAGPWWPIEDKKLEKYLLDVGDVILAMDRPIVRDELKYSWIQRGAPKSYLVQRVARLRGTTDLDTDYLRYVIGSPEFYAYVDTIITGVNVPHISGPDISKYRFPLPPLGVQKKIASILSAYDDLIENNLKRVRLLEEMAQKTYEEWFVRLRFPGFETTPIDPENNLPEGWVKKKLKDLGTVVTGKTPLTSNKAFYGQDVPFIKIPDMGAAPYVISTGQSLTTAGANSQKKKLLPRNSLLVSCIGSVGVTGLIFKPSQTNQQINAIIFDEEFYPFFTHCFSKKLKPLLDGLGSNGATMTNVNKRKFENIEFDCPTNGQLKDFHKKVSLNYNVVLSLLCQNQQLREARDILLPRLMTGMIDVDEYDPATLLKEAA